MRPLYARTITDEERERLRESLKAREGFRVRRAQMILMSADDQMKVDAIGERIGCRGQAVREAIHAFHTEGLACLERKSPARQDDQRALDDGGREQLRAIIHRSPRDFGHDTSLWTLDLLAQASFEQGLTSSRVSGETVRTTLVAMKINWRRAKHWITSPDPHYETKKNAGIG